MAKVSIVTVTYNCAERLEKTLDSISVQELTCVEVIVIDGGSTDLTEDVVSRYSKYIDIYVSEADDGIYDAMNKGVKLASGQFVFFLNSGDTFLNKDSVSELMGVLDSDQDIIIGRVLAYSSCGDLYLYPKITIQGGLMQAYSPRFLFDSHVCHQACLINRDTLLKSGSYSSKYSHFADFYSFYRIARRGDVKVVDKVFARYPLDGVSCDPGNSRILLDEKETMLKELSDEALLKQLFYRIKNGFYVMKIKLGSLWL